MAVTRSEFILKLSVSGGKNLATELAKVETELRSINDAIKKAKAANAPYDKLLAQQKLLQGVSKDLNKQIRFTTREFLETEKALPTDSFAAMRTRVIKLTKEWDALSKTARKGVGGKALRNEIRGLNEELNKGSKAIGNFRNNVGNYAKSIGRASLNALGFTAGIGAIFQVIKGGLNVIKEFDNAITILASILQTTPDRLDKLKQSALDLGATTAFTSRQVVELQTNLARLGFTQREILQSTASIIDFTLATGANTADAARLAGAAVRSFGLTAKDTERVVSVLGVATAKSALDFSRLQTALPIVGATAAAFGQNIEQTTAQLGVLSDAGLEASIAGTSLRNILVASSEVGLDYDKALELINNATDRAAKSFELFGRRGGTAGLILAQNAEQVKALTDRITDVKDELAEMADVQLTSVEGKLILMRSAYEGVITSIDDGSGILSSAFKKAVTDATKVLNTLKAINEIELSKREIEDLGNAFLNTAEGAELVRKAYLKLFLLADSSGFRDLEGQQLKNLLNVSNEIKRLKEEVDALSKFGTGGSFTSTFADNILESVFQTNYLFEQSKILTDALEDLDERGIDPASEGYVRLATALASVTEKMQNNQKEIETLDKLLKRSADRAQKLIDLGNGLARLRFDLSELQSGTEFFRGLDKINIGDFEKIAEISERIVLKNEEIREYVELFEDLSDFYKSANLAIDPLIDNTLELGLVQAQLKEEIETIESTYKKALVALSTQSDGLRFQYYLDADVPAELKDIAKKVNAEWSRVQVGDTVLDPFEFLIIEDDIEKMKQLATATAEFQANIRIGKPELNDYKLLTAQVEGLNDAFDRFNERVEKITEVGKTTPTSQYLFDLKKLQDEYNKTLNQDGVSFNPELKDGEVLKQAEESYKEYLKKKEILNLKFELKNLNDEIAIDDYANAQKINNERHTQEEILKIRTEAFEKTQKLNQLLGEAQSENNAVDVSKTKLTEEQKLDIRQRAVDLSIELISGLIENSYERELKALEDARDRRLDAIQGEYEARIKLAEGNDILQAQLILEREAREEEVRKTAFEEQKKLQLEQAVVAGYLAVVQALAGASPPYNYILAAGVATATAVEIDKIKNSTYEIGGFTKGIGERDHTGHEVAGVVHANEYVVNPKQLAARKPIIEWLERDRKRNFAVGGFTTPPPPQIFSPSNLPVSAQNNSFELSDDQMRILGSVLADEIAQKNAAATGAAVYDAVINSSDRVNRQAERQERLVNNTTY